MDSGKCGDIAPLLNHGDYCPDNIIVTADAKGNIKVMTAVDWVHATQGNASADIANTFLLLKLQFGDKSDIPKVHKCFL